MRNIESKNLIRIMAIIYLLSFTPTSMAYLGPGMSGSFLAIVIGIFGSIFILIFSILYYPLKRILRNRRNKIK